MSENTHLETLYKQAEAFGKTSITLFKYQAINKISDLISSILVFITIFLVLLLSILFASVALAFWIGECMGKIHYGFMIVALFYFVLFSILYLVRNLFIKYPLYNSLIALLQKQ